jgi:hypothetical protein
MQVFNGKSRRGDNRMTRTALSFLAGAISVGVTAFMIGGRPSVLAFCLGLLTALCILVALVGSVDRLRSAARFLHAFADGISARRAPRGSANPPAEIQTAVERDVVQALIGLKATPKIAASAARQAVRELPDGSFDEVMRAALQFTRKAAA